MLNRRQFARHASIMGCGAVLAACASKAPGTGKAANAPIDSVAVPATSAAIAAVSRADSGPIRANAAPLAVERALHLSNRLGYGPKPGDIEKILRLGEFAYIEQQLRPQSIPLPPALSAELDALVTLRMPVADSVNEYQAEIAANQTQNSTAQTDCAELDCAELDCAERDRAKPRPSGQCSDQLRRCRSIERPPESQTFYSRSRL